VADEERDHDFGSRLADAIQVPVIWDLGFVNELETESTEWFIRHRHMGP